MRIAFGVEYDGSRFHGWQRQEGVRTVQECVENALARVADCEALTVICAGRTDTGVHALGQVIHINTEVKRSPRSWVFGGNTNLPSDVALLWAKVMPEDFHARFSAYQRHYRYLIFNRPVRPSIWAGRSAWYCSPLDVALMRTAAQYLVGEHDFSSFRARGCQSKHPVRTLTRIEIFPHGEHLIVEVSANAFLQHMVRNIIGTLLAVGSGKHAPGWVKEVLEARDRNAAGITAAPEGLYFTRVDYPPLYALPGEMPR
jgi:tRNA pseudouridine38-40 synthase